MNEEEFTPKRKIGIRRPNKIVTGITADMVDKVPPKTKAIVTGITADMAPELTPLEPNDAKRAYRSRDSILKAEDLRDKVNEEIGGQVDNMTALDDETAHAHNLFLFGPKGRRPIKDLAKLAQLTGVDERKLEILAPAWKREALRIAREASPLFAMASTTESRATHALDLKRMRASIDAMEANLPPVTDKSYAAKYSMLMVARKEWRDSSGITSAINISSAMLLAEGKQMLTNAKPEDDNSESDMSAFDIDVQQID